MTAMTEDELIENAAQQAFGRSPNHRLIDALEAYWGNGSSDESCGDADTFGHYYRVDRWIVRTDSQGFATPETFDTEQEAKDAFQKIEAEWLTWEDNE